MATQSAFENIVTVEEYLSTEYEPDCEYVDGVLEARNLGEKDHSTLQRFLVVLFAIHRAEWGVEVFPELRVQIAPRQFRVPDVTVVRSDMKIGQILTVPPLIAVEIMSPEDTIPKVAAKANEYQAFGVEHVWVIDSLRRVAYRAGSNGLELVRTGEFTVDGTQIRVGLDEMFNELERG